MLEPLEWTADEWFHVPAGSDPAGRIKRPPGKPQPVRLEHSDDFASSELNPLWRFWKESGKGSHKTGDHVLALTARGESPADGRILTRITGDKSYRIEVEVEVDENAEGGLLLFYNPACYIGLSLNSKEVSLHLRGHRSRASNHSYVPSRPARCALRLVNRQHDVNLAFRAADGEWVELDTTYETSGYHHDVFGGFLDLRMALCASGQGEARFRKLNYSVL